MSIFYGYQKVAGGEDLVSVDAVLTSGTKIATIHVDSLSTDIYAPKVELSGITKIIAGSNIAVSPESNQTEVTISAILPPQQTPFYLNNAEVSSETQVLSTLSGTTSDTSPWSYNPAFVPTATQMFKTDDITTLHDSFVVIYMNIDINDSTENAYSTAIQVKFGDEWRTMAFGTCSPAGAGASVTLPLKAGTKIRGFLYTQSNNVYKGQGSNPGTSGLVVTEYYR